MTIHIGIIGGGNISRTHARAASELEGVEIVAFCGRNSEKLAELTQAYGGVAYRDADAFLSHKPMEMVLIGSPSGLHAEHGIAAAKRGLHVLVEKPIDVTVERADALIDACRVARVNLGVFFQDRCAPDLLRLKTSIDSQVLSKPILISAHVKWYRAPSYYRDSKWRGIRELDGGGALMNQGIHTLDLLLWLFGDVSRVWSAARTALHDIEVEDTLIAGLEFENGALATIQSATSAYPGLARRVEMTWEKGTVIVENDSIVFSEFQMPIPELKSRSIAPDSERSNSPVVTDISGHRSIIQDFIRAIELNRSPICDGVDGRRSVELVQAIYSSARSGHAVSVK